jgi:hypothetical protein
MKLLLLAGALEAHYLLLGAFAGLERRLVETIAVLLSAGIFYLISCRLLFDGGLRPAGIRPRWIAAAALLFRATVWPLDPALSDDVFRYRWEGKLQSAGGNPYEARPRDPEWASLRDSAFARVPGKDFKAVYGPLVELVERATYMVVSRFESDPRRQVFWFKAPAALFDLGVLAALALLLKANGLRSELSLVYAWSPLPVVEFWGMGHNDSAAILFVLLALLAAAKARWTWAFAALACGAAAKLWPALLFPLFVGWNGRRPLRWREWWIAPPVFAIFAFPYWTNIVENVRFASGFVGGWRNNDSLFGLLLWAAGGDPYAAKKAAFALMALAAAVVTLRRWPIEKGALAVVSTTLLVSANCHPWYLTWLVPLLAFYPLPAFLLWTTAAPVAYESVIRWSILGEWQGPGNLRWCVYAPVFLLLAWRAWEWSTARRRSAVLRSPRSEEA